MIHTSQKHTLTAFNECVVLLAVINPFASVVVLSQYVMRRRRKATGTFVSSRSTNALSVDGVKFITSTTIEFVAVFKSYMVQV